MGEQQLYGDGTYADFIIQYENEHPEFRAVPWYETARERRYRPAAEPEGLVSTVVNGLTGEHHVIARVADDETPAVPVKESKPPRRRSQKFHCIICEREVPHWEARAGHEHDLEAAIGNDGTIPETARHPVQPMRGPRNLNSARKAARPRKQDSRFQGLAGFSTPRSQ